MASDFKAHKVISGMHAFPSSLEVSAFYNLGPKIHHACSPLAQVLAAAISSQAKSLEVLLLGDNSMGDDGIGLLSPAIRECENLKQLDLGSNEITEKGAITLAASLPFLVRLEHLNLSGNPLGGQGVVIIAEAISCLPSLRTFHVKEAFEYKADVVKRVSVTSVRPEL